VNLQHVDAFFADIPGVLDAAGFLMPGELDFPEVWVAVVLSQPIEATAIQTDCLKQLGFILAPSQMIQVRAIPRTLTGKVKRHEMTEKLKKLLATQPEQ
jgi:acyl-coenzyme A synthetase/AMP-(fatty) acid ligase